MANSMIFMEHWLDKMKDLTEEQKGKVCYCALKYGLLGIDEPPTDPMAEMAYNFIKPQITEIQKKFTTAQNKGHAGGRPKKVNDEQIWDLAHNHRMKGAEIAEKLGVPKTTVYSSSGWRNRDDDIFLEQIKC